MSEQDDSNPVANFLLNTRELVAAGKSAYGDPSSPAAQSKLQELDAKIALGRQLGEIPPAPEPWSIQRAAAERLASEFPIGDPANVEISDVLANGIRTQFDVLGQMPGAAFAKLCDEVAADIADRASIVTMRHAAYRGADGPRLSGHQIVEALVKEAEPAIAALAEPKAHAKMVQLVRGNRKTLELLAARGRAMQSYAARKRELGL